MMKKYGMEEIVVESIFLIVDRLSIRICYPNIYGIIMHNMMLFIIKNMKIYSKSIEDIGSTWRIHFFRDNIVTGSLTRHKIDGEVNPDEL